MTAPGPIVVGYDGSEAARQALRRAAAIACPDRPVTVVTAAPLLMHLRGAPGEGAPPPDALLGEAAAYLRALGVESDTRAAPLEPADALIETARDAGARIVVVGTRGRGRAARTALGSVSTAVLQHAPCDVLIVRPPAGEHGAEPETDWPRAVVVGFDGSPSARLALEDAAAIATPGAEIALVLAVGRRARGRQVEANRVSLREACDELAGRGLSPSAVEVRGEPAAAIAEAARERDGDLVVIGSSSAGPLRRLLRRPVSAALVSRAGQDVLVVRRG